MVKLKDANPYLRSATARKDGLRMSARTSSAVEGIRAPFDADKAAHLPASREAFTDYWRRRAAATAR